jgi:tetratricopeptide (TPR) repeat protein
MRVPFWPAWCTLSASLACAPSRDAAYDRAYAAAERDESAGRLAEAADAYERAAAAAHRRRDRDQAAWSAAEVLSRAGRIDEAVRRLDSLASDASSEHQAEAALRAALLRIEHGDETRGWQELESVPRRFASHGVSHAAVRRLVEHAERQGPEAARDELLALERDLRTTELGGLVAFLGARHLDALGHEIAARDAYLSVADRWPYPGAFYDDALWHASLLDEKLGRAREAVADLQRLVAVRETTSLIGSYERALYVPAMLRMGDLYRDLLNDHAQARS